MAASVAPNSKQKRGPGRSLNLYEDFEKNNNKPLPIIYDVEGETMKAVGDNSNTYIRFISNQISENIPPYHRTWAKVPDDLKDIIYEELHHYYDIDSYRETPEWDLVKEAIFSDCKSRYKSRKHGFKKHFIDHGGYDNLEMARRLPPEGMEEDVWNETINKLFLDEGYKKQSKQNAGNRAHHLYGSYHGTSSMASKRYKQKQQMGVQPSLIDGFKDSHHKEPTGWINVLAENHYDMMIAERDAQTQAGATFVDEAEILKNVLGERRGHTKGVGRKLKTVSRYPNFFKQQSAERDEINKNLLGMQKQLVEMQQYNKSLLEALHNQFPNFQPPPMPSSQPSSEASNNED